MDISHNAKNLIKYLGGTDEPYAIGQKADVYFFRNFFVMRH
jgi:hypothetical protein